MSDIETYLQRIAQTPLASALTNLRELRSALDKLDKPDDFSIETIEKDIVGISPEFYAFIFRQAGLAASEDPVSDQLSAAIGKLGFQRVKKLIFFHVAYSNETAGGSTALDRDFASKLWTLNYRVATVAEYWAGRILPELPEELFYLGMLQNLGVSALAALEPSKHRALRESTRKVPLAEKEKEHLGVSHYELGIALVERWKLPPIHGAAMRFEESHGQAGMGFADEGLEDLFQLLYFAKYRAENRKPRTSSATESRFLVDPHFNYDPYLLQIVADRIREVA